MSSLKTTLVRDDAGNLFPLITEKDFALLVKRQKWTFWFLKERCKEVPEMTPYLRGILKGEFPERIVSYAALLRLYSTAMLPPLIEVSPEEAGIPYGVEADPLKLLQPETVRMQARRTCPCGCGAGLRKRQRYATRACGKRLATFRRQNTSETAQAA